MQNQVGAVIQGVVQGSHADIILSQLFDMIKCILCSNGNFVIVEFRQDYIRRSFSIVYTKHVVKIFSKKLTFL